MAGASDTPQTEIKKRNDAYTGLLAISFLAMVGATVLMYLELENYDNKTPPKAPVIEVPGAQLQSIPKTGGAPPPKVEPKPDDNPKEKEKENTGMVRPPEHGVPAPLLLPARETVEAAPLTEPGFIQIPDVSPASSVVVPAAASVPARPRPRPIVSALEPSLTDDPPLPTGRFVPPM